MGPSQRIMRRRHPLPPMAGGATDVMTVEDAGLLEEHERLVRAHACARQTIAVAIGLHDFAEGL